MYTFISPATYATLRAMSIAPVPFRRALLAWYGANARPLPWRAYTPPNPYHIWLAEIMLQQTTVAAVIPYYQRFLARFPTLASLAEAPLDEVLHHWQGLGYYRRAHLLHACAKAVANHHHGHFPATETGLLTLPGIGPYTAAAVAALAFNQPASVVDGNVERVISRLFRIATPLPAAKAVIKQHAATLASPTRPQAYANAIMELGATVCTPTAPSCPTCPVQRFCAAAAHGDALHYPVKAAKKKLPHLHATAVVIKDNKGNFYLRQRPVSGMLASLWEPPATCTTQPNPLGWPESSPHISANAPTATTSVTHTFSHFKLTVTVQSHTVNRPPAHTTAFAPDALPPLSTLARKILNASNP